jgi:hypothetical protein
MECGEPIAQARSVGEVGEVTAPSSGQPVRPAAPASGVPSSGAPVPPPRPAAAPIPSSVNRPTVKAKQIRPARRDEEPEAIRCPGCGIPTTKPRCPGCGVKLRDEDA